jgi:hypothetical protein
MIPLSPWQSRGKIGAAALVRRLPGHDVPTITGANALRFSRCRQRDVEESGECVSYFT